jgi:hypothetical protein
MPRMNEIEKINCNKQDKMTARTMPPIPKGLKAINKINVKSQKKECEPLN